MRSICVLRSCHRVIHLQRFRGLTGNYIRGICWLTSTVEWWTRFGHNTITEDTVHISNRSSPHLNRYRISDGFLSGGLWPMNAFKDAWIDKYGERWNSTTADDYYD